ncbi:hypothetical protein ACNKHR_08035 [Shigella flexneri]
MTVFDATCPLVTKVHMEVAAPVAVAKNLFSSVTPGAENGRDDRATQ